jgi:hypothetical protein
MRKGRSRNPQNAKSIRIPQEKKARRQKTEGTFSLESAGSYNPVIERDGSHTLTQQARRNFFALIELKRDARTILGKPDKLAQSLESG